MAPSAGNFTRGALRGPPITMASLVTDSFNLVNLEAALHPGELVHVTKPPPSSPDMLKAHPAAKKAGHRLSAGAPQRSTRWELLRSARFLRQPEHTTSLCHYYQITGATHRPGYVPARSLSPPKRPRSAPGGLTYTPLGPTSFVTSRPGIIDLFGPQQPINFRSLPC